MLVTAIMPTMLISVPQTVELSQLTVCLRGCVNKPTCCLTRWRQYQLSLFQQVITVEIMCFYSCVELLSQKTEEIERMMNEKKALIADILQIPLHDYDTITEVCQHVSVNNTDTKDSVVYAAVIISKSLRSSHYLSDEFRTVPSSCRPSDQARRLGFETACRLLLSAPTVAI